MSKQTVEFITKYREGNNSFTHPSQLLNMKHKYKETGNSNSRRGRRGRRGPAETKEVTITSGVSASNLADVLDRLTTRQSKPGQRIRDLVNVNTASADVLRAVFVTSGASDAEVDRFVTDIIAVRAGLDVQLLATPAWLITEEIVDEVNFKKVAPKLCARSMQYHFFCVGFCSPGGQFIILEVVLDFGLGAPRIAYLRDVTRLGIPQRANLNDEEI